MMRKRILQGFALLILVPALVVLGYWWCNGQLTFLAPQSHLEPLDERINSVEEEFMRRSPRLRQEFALFQRCSITVGCDTRPIVARKNAIIHSMWPEMWERLTTESDWGEERLSREGRIRFQEAVRHAGGREKSRRCFPLITFRHNSPPDGNISYYFEGFRCP